MWFLHNSNKRIYLGWCSKTFFSPPIKTDKWVCQMHQKCPSKGRSQYFSLNLSVTDLSSTQTHFYSTTKACVQIDGVPLHANHVGTSSRLSCGCINIQNIQEHPLSKCFTFLELGEYWKRRRCAGASAAALFFFRNSCNCGILTKHFSLCSNNKRISGHGRPQTNT